MIRPISRIRKYFGQLVCDITCFYFRLTSQPQDVGLGPDEGDVGPINGHPEKRWVMKSLKQCGPRDLQHDHRCIFRKNPSQCKYQRDNLPFCYIHIWLYFHFSFILDPTTCQTWNFIFLGQMIFCEKSESLRWYVRFLIHNRLYSQDFKRLKPF